MEKDLLWLIIPKSKTHFNTAFCLYMEEFHQIIKQIIKTKHIYVYIFASG